MNDAQLAELLEEKGPTKPDGRKRADEREPCVKCRLHAARIGEEIAARYYPPLGLTIAVPTTSGGLVYICPRCSTIRLNGEPTTLLAEGLLNRKAIRRSKLRLDV